MLHLIKYDILVKIKNFNAIFWSLFFPLILGTLFYFAFGQIDEADFEAVPAAVVAGEDADTVFMDFLKGISDSEEPLIQLKEMSQAEAAEALNSHKISGIFVVNEAPSLTVSGNGLEESILQSLLESYENGKKTLTTVALTHPEGMEAAIEQMSEYTELVQQVSLGGKTTDGNAQFFYALIAMPACTAPLRLWLGNHSPGQSDGAGRKTLCHTNPKLLDRFRNAVVLFAAFFQSPCFTYLHALYPAPEFQRTIPGYAARQHDRRYDRCCHGNLYRKYRAHG